MDAHVDTLLNNVFPPQTERTEFGRTFKWLELLSTHGSGVFDKITAILASRGYGWLANEMYADLESERGMLQIEEYVFREAGQRSTVNLRFHLCVMRMTNANATTNRKHRTSIRVLPFV